MPHCAHGQRQHQGKVKVPTWTYREDFAVAGTYLYLEDKLVLANYLDRTLVTGRGKFL